MPPVKMQHAISLVIPKAAWGAWTSLGPVRTLNGIVKKLAWGGHHQASNDLFFLLAGHGFNPEICAAMQAYSFLATEVRRRARPWPQRAPCGTWLHTVRTWLESLGWEEASPFHWRHPIILKEFQWRRPLNIQEIDAEAHHIRKSWRRPLFDDFLASSRRDAPALGSPAYVESKVKCAQTVPKRRHPRSCCHDRGRGV